MKELVIDASVILKWYLPDEEFAQKALNILGGHVSGDIALYAPTILPYEILNALIVAERMGRVNEEVTKNAFNAFLDLEINFLNPFLDYRGILSLARSFDRSVYDASYLAVANKRDTDFVTGDRRLFNAVRKELKSVKWIGQ
jgi:predicted nucleic acid-binding protein